MFGVLAQSLALWLELWHVAQTWRNEHWPGKTYTPLFQDIQMLYRRWVEDRVVTFDDAETDGAKDDAETDEAEGSRHTSAH